MAKIYHRNADAKTLHSFPLLSAVSNDNNRVVFLSERDFAILLNCLELTERLKNRVFYSSVGDLYEIVDDEDFVIFQGWVQELYFNLGEWQLSNLLLERIAVALENMEANQQSVVTLEDTLAYIETTYGATSALFSFLSNVFGMLPDLSFKIPVMDVATFIGGWIYNTQTLVARAAHTATTASISTAIGAHLPVAMASALADKLLGIAGLIADASALIQNWISGELQGYGFLSTIWNWMFGGDDDPPTDGEATQVRMAVALETIAGFEPTVNVTCTACGSSGGCGCGAAGSASGGPFGIEPGVGDGQPGQGTPPIGWDPEADGEFFTYKCKAANVLLLNLAEYLATIDATVNHNYSLNVTPQDAINFIADRLLNTMPGLGWLMLNTAMEVAEGIACNVTPDRCPSDDGTELIPATGSSFFNAVRLEVLSQREDFVCAIFNAQNPSGVTTAIADLIGPIFADIDPTLADFGSSVVSPYISNNGWRNRLFEPDASIANYTDSTSVDCVLCAPDCFDFADDLQGWSIVDDGGGSPTLEWGAGGVAVFTSGSDQVTLPEISSPPMSHVVEAGDELSVCFTADPVPIGIRFTVVIDGVDEIVDEQGSVVDHIAARQYPLEDFVGQTLQGIRLAMNKAGGGSWELEEVGVNCPCTEG